jgi:CRISPR-associated exonuclease Cas4
MLIIGAICLIIGLLVLWVAGRQRRNSGLPGGRLIYVDTTRWAKVEKPLYDPLSGLTGRPDYLVEQNGVLLPVEVKSTRIGTAPYDAHIYQMAAYCLLVERIYGKRPSYGILYYPNGHPPRSFAVDYTSTLKTALLALVEEIQARGREKEINRSHDSVARCQRCGFRSLCEQRLGS